METEVEAQQSLLDLSGKQFNINWVDDKQPLFIANNPLHWKAHKLQILIGRLEKQAERNPAQFNSRNYIDAVNELERCMIKINKGVTADVLESDDLEGIGNDAATPTMGEGASISMDTRISSDNPFSR